MGYVQCGHYFLKVRAVHGNSDVKTKNANFKLANVFDHDAEPGIIQELRSAVADDLHWMFRYETTPHN
jgi:hypothetical protein